MIRRWLARAAMKAAADPRVREKAAEVYEREVKPRARAAIDGAKPTVRAARDDVRAAARESESTPRSGWLRQGTQAPLRRFRPLGIGRGSVHGSGCPNRLNSL